MQTIAASSQFKFVLPTEMSALSFYIPRFSSAFCKCIMYSLSPFKGKSQQSMWWQVPVEGRCRLADTECLSYFQTYVPQSHFSTADRCIGLHNKNVLLVKMITSCEQNCSITPCDWCLDISQITTLHKP